MSLIQLELLTGPLTGIYDPNGMGAMFFAVLAVAGQIERNYIREKTLEGQVIAASKGNHGGRPKVIDDDMLTFAVALAPRPQPVLATPDRSTALQWYETLQPMGVEGIVAEPGRSPYPFGRRTAWLKIRHADTVDARVLGSIGPRRRPRALALLLPGATRPRLSARLAPALAARIGAALADTPATGEHRAGDERYTALDTELVEEVLAGSGRHGTLTVVRIR